MPALIVGLLTVHLAILWRQKHTQFPGRGRTERNVVGSRLWPTYTAKTLGLLASSSSRCVARARRPRADQPDLAVRPVRPGRGDAPPRSPTGTSAGSRARSASPAVAAARVRAHHPGGVLARRAAARPHVRPALRVAVHRAALHPRPRRAPPARPSARPAGAHRDRASRRSRSTSCCSSPAPRTSSPSSSTCRSSPSPTPCGSCSSCCRSAFGFIAWKWAHDLGVHEPRARYAERGEPPVGPVEEPRATRSARRARRARRGRPGAGRNVATTCRRRGRPRPRRRARRAPRRRARPRRPPRPAIPLARGARRGPHPRWSRRTRTPTRRADPLRAGTRGRVVCVPLPAGDDDPSDRRARLHVVECLPRGLRTGRRRPTIGWMAPASRSSSRWAWT